MGHPTRSGATRMDAVDRSPNSAPMLRGPRPYSPRSRDRGWPSAGRRLRRSPSSGAWDRHRAACRPRTGSKATGASLFVLEGEPPILVVRRLWVGQTLALVATPKVFRDGLPITFGVQLGRAFGPPCRASFMRGRI